MIQVKRLRQLSGAWPLALLIMGDIAIAIATYELAWHIPTLSSFGIFWKLLYPEAARLEDSLVNAPHNYWAVVVSQIVLFSLAGLHRVKNFTPKRTLLRIPPILFVQMMFLSLFYLLTFARRNLLLAIFPVFWILNSIFTSLWRILTFYPGPLSTFFGKTGGRRDLARILILGFMILLISCAFLLIFKAEETAEEVANVAYFFLVIGVGMGFAYTVGRKNE